MVEFGANWSSARCKLLSRLEPEGACTTRTLNPGLAPVPGWRFAGSNALYVTTKLQSLVCVTPPLSVNTIRAVFVAPEDGKGERAYVTTAPFASDVISGVTAPPFRIKPIVFVRTDVSRF